MMLQPFYWGAGGRALSPEDKQREVATSLQPLANPMQGLALLADAAVDNWQSNPRNWYPAAPGQGGGMRPGSLFGLFGNRNVGLY